MTAETEQKTKKVAIVHDFFLKMGGAERTVKSMIEAYPQADLFTLIFDPILVEQELPETKVVGSWLQKLPTFLRNRYRLFFSLLRRAVETWDFSEYDLVISSSSAFAHGVVTNLQTKQVCYYHSPTRYLWDWYNNYLKEMRVHGLFKLALQWLLGKQRVWDFLAAQRPEVVLANSEHVAKRIKKFYRRDAEVLYPPVDIERFQKNLPTSEATHEPYYLFVGTLSPYKNVELAVKFFNKIGHKFLIVGDGKDFSRLQALAKSNVQLLGAKDDREVTKLMQNCKALIFPGEEDFGIAIVEAMACGKPVFAYGKGGALETVKEGETGWFFTENNLGNFEKNFMEFLRNYEYFVPQKIAKFAEKFSAEKFKQRLKQLAQ